MLCGASCACLATLCGNIYNGCRHTCQFVNRKHHHVNRLDRRFEDLAGEVGLLRSQIRNGEDMLQWNVITDRMTIENYRNFLGRAHSRICRFNYLKEKYDKVPRKVNNRHTSNQQDVGNSHGEVDNRQTMRNHVDVANSRGGEGDRVDNHQRNNQDGRNSHREEVLRNEPKYVYGWIEFCELANLSKRILELSTEVANLRQEMAREGMTWRKPEQVVKVEGADKIDDVKCLNDTLEDILRDLRDDEVKRIVVWGLPGVGKTTILKNLNNRLMDGSSTFDIVIRVTVPEKKLTKTEGENKLTRTEEYIDAEYINAVTMKIKQDLIARLKLPVEDNSTDTISRVLGGKKYLVILDQVSSEINLGEVGISREHRYGKVVFASRGKKVMEADSKIQVNHLPERDAWALFETLLGNINAVRSDSIMRGDAELIVRELAGLPMLIKAMVAQLKHDTTESAWRAKRILLQSRSDTDDPLLKKEYAEISNVFNLAYQELGDQWKRCLLYTARFPRSYEINEENLRECWTIEQLIQVHNCTFIEARDTGYGILTDLIYFCLLQRNDLSYITMFEPFRRCARKISYPTDDHENFANRIHSLMCSTEMQHSLPQTPEMAPTLLLLQSNAEETIALPEAVFGGCGAHRLRVLNFWHTGIKFLPSTLFSLTTLQGLYLNDCQHLCELSNEIGTLNNLKVLDIRGTAILRLPIGIGQLSSLKCFRVSFQYVADGSVRDVIPPNVVYGLHNLEELTISIDPSEQSWNETSVEYIVMEMASLRQLTSLCFYFPSENSLTNFLDSRRNEDGTPAKRFISYKMRVGRCYELHTTSGSSSNDHEVRHLIFSAGEGNPCAIEEVLRDATTFELIGHKGCQSLSHFGIGNMESLKVCVIKECKEMTSIVDGNHNTADTAFPELEKLHIANLQYLNCIVSGSQVKTGSLAKLTTLTLTECHVLGKVFSLGIVHQLQQLRDMTVKNCSQVDEIIEVIDNHYSGATTSTGGGDHINRLLAGTFHKLENLHLVNLPNLTRICPNEYSLDWHSLKKIEIKECGILTSLKIEIRECEVSERKSLSNTNAKQLKVIDCSQHWWINVLDLQEDLRNCLGPLCPFELVHQASPPPCQNASDPTSASTGPGDEPTYSSCFPFWARPRGGKQNSKSQNASDPTSASAKPVSTGHGKEISTSQSASASTSASAGHFPKRHGKQILITENTYASTSASAGHFSKRHGKQILITENASASNSARAGPDSNGDESKNSMSQNASASTSTSGVPLSQSSASVGPLSNEHGNESSMSQNASAPKSARAGPVSDETNAGPVSNEHGNESSMSQNAYAPTSASATPVSNEHGNENSMSQNASVETSTSVGPLSPTSASVGPSSNEHGNESSMSQNAFAPTSASSNPGSNGNENENSMSQNASARTSPNVEPVSNEHGNKNSMSQMPLRLSSEPTCSRKWPQ